MSLIQLTNYKNCLICEKEFVPAKTHIKSNNVCFWCYIRTELKTVHTDLLNDEAIAITKALSLLKSKYYELEKTAWNNPFAREGMIKLQSAHGYLKFLLDGDDEK